MPIVRPIGGDKPKNRDPLHQPAFDPRIKHIHIPGGSSTLNRGYMVWENILPGYAHRCVFRFLYNPTTVEASYSLPDSGVQSALVFPNAHDIADLRIPINQYVSFSLLFDRTFELWGSYKSDGSPRYKNYADGNSPYVVGVWSDIIQLEEFTGMNVGYSAGTSAASNISLGSGKSGGATTLSGHQGILQLVPSWVYFGNQSNLHYYGYVSSWDVTYTHWTQYMVPMRAAVDITFNLLPPPSKQTNLSWVSGNGGWQPPQVNGKAQAAPTNSGKAGR